MIQLIVLTISLSYIKKVIVLDWGVCLLRTGMEGLSVKYGHLLVLLADVALVSLREAPELTGVHLKVEILVFTLIENQFWLVDIP